MTDHDRDTGSRGEEPPRDPSRRHPAEQPRTENLASGPPPVGMPYGGPEPYTGPGWGPLPPLSPKPTFLDFLRRKRTQVVGAGLAGLVVGGIIGGGAVALTGALAERPGPHTPWDRPYFQDRPGRMPPDERGPHCYQTEGRVICELAPAPLPTRIG